MVVDGLIGGMQLPETVGGRAVDGLPLSWHLGALRSFSVEVGKVWGGVGEGCLTLPAVAGAVRLVVVGGAGGGGGGTVGRWVCLCCHGGFGGARHGVGKSVGREGEGEEDEDEEMEEMG
jgi:hypothetical protein